MPYPRLRGRRREGRDAAREQTKGLDENDQGAAGRRRVDDVIADLKPYLRLEAVAACIRTRRTNGDRMRSNLCRTPGSQVESRSQRPARRQMLPEERPLDRLPRLESLQRRSRLTKKRETHPRRPGEPNQALAF